MKRAISRFYKLFLLITIFLNFGTTDLFGQNFKWVSAVGATMSQSAEAVTTDSLGYVYVTGYFFKGIYGKDTLTAAGNFADIYIAKYDTLGNCLWARRAGGSTGNDYGYGIIADDKGHIYVTGEVSSSTVDFGDSVMTTYYGQADFFLAKYDTSGNFIWVCRGGGSTDDITYDLVIDKSDNIYLAGRATSAPVKFGGGMQIAKGGALLIKYDSSGTYLWAKAPGPYGEAYGIGVDGAGNVYYTGSFQNSATFGTITLTSAGQYDYFVAKYTPAGNCSWAKKAGGTSNEYGKDIRTDAQGNSYVTGYYGGTIDFTCKSFTNSTGSYEFFIIKYDSTGKCIWANRALGGSGAWATHIDIDKSGNSYLTGWFMATFTFDTYTLTGKGDHDIFALKYDASGMCIGAIRAGGGRLDEGRGIAVSNKGKVYVAGTFGNLAKFDTATYTTYSNTVYNSFVCLLDTGNFIVTEMPFINAEDGYAARIFPNPSGGQTRISMVRPFERLNAQLDIIIYSVDGRKIAEFRNVRDDEFVFNTEFFPEGMYSYTIAENGMPVKAGKFCVMHP